MPCHLLTQWKGTDGTTRLIMQSIVAHLTVRPESCAKFEVVTQCSRSLHCVSELPLFQAMFAKQAHRVHTQENGCFLYQATGLSLARAG